jgi:glycosyltransferase involved in cell wall biosynthesis
LYYLTKMEQVIIMHTSDTSEPLVSVIVPVYNVQEFLADCIESILNQTYSNIEILCVNDGSKDSSAAILKKYERMDSRIVVFEQTQMGLGAARNTALRVASGEFILFVDSDDKILPQLLEVTVNKAIAWEADIVLFKYRSVNYGTGVVTPFDGSLKTHLLPGKERFSPQECQDLFYITDPNVWSKLFRRSLLFSSLPLEFRVGEFAEDIAFTYTAMASANTIAVVDEFLYDYLFARPKSLANSKLELGGTIVDALLSLKDNLQQRGLLQNFIKSYAHRVVVNLQYELERGYFAGLVDLLDQAGLEGLAIAQLEPGDFPSLEAYLEYQILLGSIEVTKSRRILEQSCSCHPQMILRQSQELDAGGDGVQASPEFALRQSQELDAGGAGAQVSLEFAFADILAKIREKSLPAAFACLYRKLHSDSPLDAAKEMLANPQIIPPVIPREIKCVAMVYERVRHGGAEMVIAELCKLFSDLGLRVVLLTEEEANAADFSYPESVKRVVLPDFSNPDLYLTRAAAIAKAIDEYQIDLMMHHRWNHPLTFWDALVARLCGVSFVVHCHNFFLNHAFWNGFEQIDCLLKCYRLYDGVITLSRVDREYWACVNPNVWFVHNPLSANICTYNCTNICTNTQALPASRESQRDCQGPKHLIWVGRLAIEKQYSDLIEIIRQLIASCPDIILHVLGDAETSEVRQRFIDNIAEAGLSERIVFDGWVSDLTPYYEKATLLLGTSLFEGWGLNFYECLSYAVPVVSYDLPYLEVFRESGAVAAVPQGDTKAFATTLARVLGDERQLQRMRQNALEFIAKERAYDFRLTWQSLLADIGAGGDAASVGADAGAGDAASVGADAGAGAGEAASAVGAAALKTPDIASKTLMIESIFATYKRGFVPATERCDEVRAEVEREYQSSISYRLGRALTFLPRKLLGR